MPTLLGRRYYRKLESVSGTEKVAGVFILLLVAGIAAGFVVQATTGRGDLFGVDPAAYQAQPAGREVAAAEQTLPALDRPGWRAPKTVDRFSADNLYVKIDGRAEVYLQFNVVGLTFGTYCHETDGDRGFDVYWYDMGEDVNAFGIYQAEASPEATPVPIGRQG